MYYSLHYFLDSLESLSFFSLLGLSLLLDASLPGVVVGGAGSLGGSVSVCLGRFFAACCGTLAFAAALRSALLLLLVFGISMVW